MNVVRLDAASVEAVAARVVELLREEKPAVGATDTSELVDAAEVARRFGVSRDCVYAHADELGAIRVGTGSRPRLRFDQAIVAERLRLRGNAGKSSTPGAECAAEPASSRRRRRSGRSERDLLPIRGARP
jgi:hypothetical protein